MHILRNHHFWLILILFALCSLLHYVEQIGTGGTESPSVHFGMSRHTLDRLLFLLPIIYSGFVFRLAGGLATCLAASLVMLPRAIYLSPVPRDALLEVGGIVAIGSVVCYWLWVRAKEKERFQVALVELESAHQLLQGYVRSARDNEKRLSTLNAIANVLTESLELENVLRRAVSMVMELMDVEVVLIFSLDEETQELVLVAYDGVSDEFACAVDRMKIGEGFNGEVAKTGQPMVVEDASSDPRLTRPEVKKMKIEAQLIVPMTLRGRVRGTLCVAMRRPRQFLTSETELLSAVAAQIGGAFENARLYEKEHLTAQRLAASERDYRELFENANDAIWVHNLAGDIVVANKATEILTGYSAEELSQMNVSSFLLDEGLGQARQIWRNLVEDEPVAQPYEQRLLRKDGTEAILMLTTNLKTEDGKPSAFQNIARDVTRERRMQKNLQYYLSQITMAQEEERKRIARELHDDTSQILYALSRQLDNFLRSNMNLAPNDAGFLRELRTQLNDALEEVHRFSQALRPPMLDDLGLLPAVRWLSGELKRVGGMSVDLRVVGIERRFSPEAELLLFRIVQEALANVRRHAEASKVEVVLEFAENKTMVTISDNGKGFQLPEATGDLSRLGKLGLLGMEERARLLNGRLTVQSELGIGTTITVVVPV